MKYISSVRKYGAEKYGSTEDWRTTEPTRHFDAAIRHINAHLDGEYFDSVSKLPHLAHAASNIMFEIERIETARYNRILLQTNQEITIECPRCHSKDMYLLDCVSPCTNGCRYVIDPLLIDSKGGFKAT